MSRVSTFPLCFAVTHCAFADFIVAPSNALPCFVACALALRRAWGVLFLDVSASRIKPAVLKQNNYRMIVCTTLLVLAFFLLLPLRLNVNFVVAISEKCAFLGVKLYCFPLLDERFVPCGRYVRCSGTVEGDVDVTQGGSGIGRAIRLKSFALCLRLNFSTKGAAALPVAQAVCMAAQYAGRKHGCRSSARCVFSLSESLTVRCVAETTLAEVLAALIKGAKK